MTKLDSTQQNRYLSHATLKQAQCSYQRASGTLGKVFLHCIIIGFPKFTFTVHMDYWTMHYQLSHI